MTKRRGRQVSEDSVRNVKKRQREIDYGEYHHDEEIWTDEEIDDLYEGFLVHEWRHISARDCFHKRFGRSVDAVNTMLWKGMVLYIDPKTGQPSSAFYYRPNPSRRTRRRGPFTDRDKALLDKWLHNRDKYGQATLAHASGVLGRDEEETRWYLTRYPTSLPHRGAISLMPAKKDPSLDFDELLAVMAKLLEGWFNKVIKKLGH